MLAFAQTTGSHGDFTAIRPPIPEASVMIIILTAKKLICSNTSEKMETNNKKLKELP